MANFISEDQIEQATLRLLAAQGGFALELDLDVEVRGLDKNAAIELVKKGHEVCPYSNATRGNIAVRLHVSVVETFDI